MLSAPDYLVTWLMPQYVKNGDGESEQYSAVNSSQAPSSACTNSIWDSHSRTNMGYDSAQLTVPYLSGKHLKLPPA